jgi:hypothetical protein
MPSRLIASFLITVTVIIPELVSAQSPATKSAESVALSTAHNSTTITNPMTTTADLTDAPRKLLHAEIEIPVEPGPFTFTAPSGFRETTVRAVPSVILLASSSPATVSPFPGDVTTSIRTRFISTFLPG